MRTTTAGRAAIIAAALLCCVACTSAPAPGPSPSPAPAVLADLRRVALPDGLQPSALEVSGDDLIIAGHTPTDEDRRPALAALHDGAAQVIRVIPNSPYATVADLVSIAADGPRLAALGAAHGGAHANFRWTIWTGTTKALVDRPQTFETFGGESAGSLTDVVTTPGGPRIVGSWQGQTALDIAIWRPDADRWTRQSSAGTPLANTATLQVSGRSAAPTSSGMIIAGSVLDLSGGVRQSAAIWLSSDSDRKWRLIRLPDPGARSEALSARCSTTRCIVAGYVDGRLSLWSVVGGQAERLGALPGIAIDVDGPAPQVIAAEPEPVVAFSAAGRVGVLEPTTGGWSTRSGPAGSLVAAAEVGGRIYLATNTSPDQSELWSGEAG